MKYVQPYGETDLDAPYINGDPSIGRMGSIPPAAAFEHPMRELVNIIEMNSVEPDDADLTQVGVSIRSQRSNYAQDTGSVNALSIALDPPLTAYSIGLPLRVKVANTNTGPSTINAGAGAVSIRKPTGAVMASGDLPAGGLIELVYDGTNFQMINFGGTGGGSGSTFLVNIPYVVDTGTVNNLVANFSPAITSLVPGTIIMVKIANTNTTFAQINVNGLGNKQIYAQGGNATWPLLPSDLVVGDVVILTYDGTRFWVYANTIINQSVGFNVSNTSQINSLFEALGRKRILPGYLVIVQMASGIYSHFQTYHPNADRIQVKGTMLAANPTFSDFAKTGNSAAARANDSANNIAMLRTRYGTEVRFTNAEYSGAVSHTGPGLMTFIDILVTGQNVDGGVGKPYLFGFASSQGNIYLIGCSVWGSGGHGVAIHEASGYYKNSFACGNFASGFTSNINGHQNFDGCGSYGNAEAGSMTANGATAFAGYRSGVPGLPNVPASEFKMNGQYGVVSTGGGQASFDRSNITGNPLDVLAQAASDVTLMSAVYGTTSPAINVTGNNNSIVNYAVV